MLLQSVRPFPNYNSQDHNLYSRRCENLKSNSPESASELYRPSDRSLSAKLMPTLADIVSRGQRNGSPRPLISVF
jgi:hypothetical protein